MKSEAVGTAWGNRMNDAYTKEVTTEKTQTVTDSIQVSASAKANVYKVVELEMRLNLSREWVKSEKYTEKLTLNVPPGTKVWETGDFPMLRYTGDFTIKSGGTTWKLVGVNFDSPDPDPTPDRMAAMTWHSAPLTDQDKGIRSIQDVPDVIRVG